MIIFIQNNINFIQYFFHLSINYYLCSEKNNCMKIKRFSFLALIILLLFGCGKEQLFVLKPVMEARSRGVPWVADKSVYAFYISNPKQLFLYGTAKDMRTFYLLASQVDTVPHWYSFTPGNPNLAFFKSQEIDCNNNFYQTAGSAKATGLLILSKEDTISKRLSGTFKYKAFRTDGDSVIITNGIFADVQYNMGQKYGNTLTAIAGGTAWTAIDVACEIRDNIRITALSISLSTGIPSMFAIDLPKDAKPGPYTLFPLTSSMAIYETNLFNPDTQVSKSGTVEVTMHNTTDKVIEGKFKFTALSSLGTQTEITDGLFSVKYE